MIIQDQQDGGRRGPPGLWRSDPGSAAGGWAAPRPKAAQALRRSGASCFFAAPKAEISWSAFCWSVLGVFLVPFCLFCVSRRGG